VPFLKRLSLLFLFGMLSLVVSGANAAGTTQIQGRVSDGLTGQPITGAQIRVTGGFATTTAADGDFLITGIVLTGDNSIVTVTVSATNYGDYTLKDTVIYADDTLLLNITLTTAPQMIDAGGLPGDNAITLPPDESGGALSDDLNLPFFWSHDIMPATIRVAMTGRNSCGYTNSSGQFVYYPVQRVDTVDFKQYAKNVLPSEWISSWNGASLRAGAMAVKMYAWYKLNLGPRTRDGFTFDVWGNTCDQMYIPGREFASTNAAVDETWNYLMRRNGQVVRIHYTSTDQVCSANNLTPCMSQWGSKAYGDQGYDWQSILQIYYAPMQITYGLGELPTNQNLIRNGTFADGINSWLYGGDMNAPTVTSGSMSAVRSANVTVGWAAVYQDLGYSSLNGRPFEITLQLSNQSASIKDVTVSLRNSASWTGAISCYFPLPAGVGLQTFVVRGLTSGNWPDLRFELDLNTPDASVLLDSVSVTYQPALAVGTTECVRPSPLNDLFINRTNIAPGGATIRQGINGASVSGNDPALPCINGNERDYTDSIWFQYTPPTSQTVQLNTGGSSYNTVMAVFTGSSTLTRIACNDNYNADSTASYLTFNANAGTTYQIMVARRGDVNPALPIVLTLNLNRLGLIAPAGAITTDYGNPPYIWPDVNADYYYLYVQTTAGVQVINEVLATGALCTGGICGLDATTLRENYRLSEGSYTAYMNTWKNGAPGEVLGPFNFTIDANIPALVTMGAATNANTLRPTINWTLAGSAASATFFRLYIAPTANLGAFVLHQEFTRSQACGSAAGTTCSIQTPLGLINNTGYSAFVQSCGIGGCTTTGGPYNNGYAGAQTLTVAVPLPNLPSAIAVNTNNGLPTILWTDDPKATSFNVVIGTAGWATFPFYQNYPRTGNCNGATCQVKPLVALTNGIYGFAVQGVGALGASQGGTYNNGYGVLENQALNLPLPIAPTNFITPTNTIETGSPTFEWATVPNAISYQLWVGTGAPSYRMLYQAWTWAAAPDCTPHPGTCRITLPQTLSSGNYAWNVQPFGTAGMGAWGAGMAFTIGGTVPGLVTLNTPANTISDYTPTFTWADTSIATRYRLWVGNPAVTVSHIYTWYDDAAVCSAGVCSVSVPTLILANGNYLWNVQAANAAGEGAWTSTGKAFTVAVPPPNAPTLVSPADDAVIFATNRPTFSWNTVPRSQGYYLEVINGTGALVYGQVHYSADATCSPTSCTVQLPNPIPYGGYRWRVVPGNLNAGGTPSEMRDFVSLSVNTQPMMAQADDSRISRSGTWNAGLDEHALGDNTLINATTGETLTLTFSGTQVDVIYVAAPGFGSFTLEIDGIAFQTVNANALALTYGQIATVRGLPAGTHTLRLIAQGQVAIDAVSVDGEIMTALAPVLPTVMPTLAPIIEATEMPIVPTLVPSIEVTPEATSAQP